MKTKIQSLTTGSLAGGILVFSLPLVLSNVLQIVFNLSDVAVVGRFAGDTALGAVGSTTIFVSLFTGFLIGIGAGVNSLAALFFGARDDRAVTETVHTSFIIALAVGVILWLAGTLSANAVLTLLGTKAEFFDGALLYLRIVFTGLPALAMYNFGSAVWSAVGNTKKPLAFLSAAGVLNVILNLVFVIVFGLGVAGVALATVISQYVSAVLTVASLTKAEGSFRLTPKSLKFSAGKAKRVIALAVPAGCQNAIFAVANLFIQSGVNSFDATTVEGCTAGANFDYLVYDVMAAFYVAASSFMAQNLGAGKRSRILKSYFLSLFYSFAIAALIGGVIALFPKAFLSLFTADGTVAAAGARRMRIMGLSYCVSAFMDCTIAASRGLGKTAVPTFIVIMGSCVFRVIWVYTVFAHFGTVDSLYLLYVFSWTLTAAAEIAYFAAICRRTLRDLSLKP